MKITIKEKGINRVVGASCSPRTHEPLFRETIREVGLNIYLFEMANIRDQNTWVHQSEPAKATAKAKDLVRMSVAKAALIEPLSQISLGLVKTALVVGGGVSGMESALSFADQGFPVHLVEKTDILGGNANLLQTTWMGEKIAPYVQSLIDRVKNHPLLTLHMNHEVLGASGIIGNFSSTIGEKGRPETKKTIEHGVIVLATGGHEYKPTEYLYGEDNRIMTHLETDVAIRDNDPRVANPKSVVFIQCVGSRIPERPYCSKVCCAHSIENAVHFKKKNPDTQVYVLYRDIRAYGFREDIYKEARELGVIFIRYDLENKPVLEKNADGSLSLTVVDHVIMRPILLNPDLVCLASAILPNEVKGLTEIYKVALNAEGF
ncbi:MAG: CoB--CoM heterodisulfide reductase iron-sulfur subunit A family protein, partial [Deltaproteobacteria bacterium]|nr:CoB--CoM heterodisulfide reductase iron-sulfur subunit A family protein [Deltaproteobacteria bacterium]